MRLISSFFTCMNSRKSFNMYIMARGIFIFIALVLATVGADAASVRGVSTATRNGRATATSQTANPASGYTYNYMYPYLNNQMRTALNPGVTTSQSTSPINAVVRTEQLSSPRRVVARSAKKGTTTNTTAPAQVARRVVARPNTARVATNNDDVYRPTNIRDNTQYRDDAVTTDAPRGRLNESQRNAAVLTPYPETRVVSSARCLADYTECMDSYCVREDTAYNRCFCSAKLAQIDATYQPAIESLVNQIVSLKYGSPSWSDAEMNEYWMNTIGKYTGDNSWQKLDDLLNIDWSTMENRTRGQNAFATGHEYCVQHIQGCFYMASNLRDAYRSRISTDCATYESSLQKLKNAAESVIEAYQE